MPDRLKGQTSMSRYKQGGEYDLATSRVPSGDAVKRVQKTWGCNQTGLSCSLPHGCTCTEDVNRDGFGN